MTKSNDKQTKKSPSRGSGPYRPNVGQLVGTSINYVISIFVGLPLEAQRELLLRLIALFNALAVRLGRPTVEATTADAGAPATQIGPKSLFSTPSAKPVQQQAPKQARATKTAAVPEKGPATSKRHVPAWERPILCKLVYALRQSARTRPERRSTAGEADNALLSLALAAISRGTESGISDEAILEGLISAGEDLAALKALFRPSTTGTSPPVDVSPEGSDYRVEHFHVLASDNGTGVPTPAGDGIHSSIVTRFVVPEDQVRASDDMDDPLAELLGHVTDWGLDRLLYTSADPFPSGVRLSNVIESFLDGRERRDHSALRPYLRVRLADRRVILFNYRLDWADQETPGPRPELLEAQVRTDADPVPDPPTDEARETCKRDRAEASVDVEGPKKKRRRRKKKKATKSSSSSPPQPPPGGEQQEGPDPETKSTD